MKNKDDLTNNNKYCCYCNKTISNECVTDENGNAFHKDCLEYRNAFIKAINKIE